jgi:hypothetical protein
MSPPDEACPNCGTAHGPDDIFCESCGYDFITGSLPSPDEVAKMQLNVAAQVAAAAAPPAAPANPGSAVPGPAPGAGPMTPPMPAGPVVRFEITVDRAYFDAAVSEGELEFPDPTPEAKVLELTGTEIHLGRTSQSRAIHPDLDLAQLTVDPAVSSRHAVIRVGPDGELKVSDVGSTNGTIVGAVDSPAIGQGEARPLASGDSIYLGAWTRLVVTVDPPATP